MLKFHKAVCKCPVNSWANVNVLKLVFTLIDICVKKKNKICKRLELNDDAFHDFISQILHYTNATGCNIALC